MRGGEARADTEQQKRGDTVPSVSEWMLRCDGIRRGAYDLVESPHARGACALVRLLFEKGSSKVYDYSTAKPRFRLRMVL